MQQLKSQGAQQRIWLLLSRLLRLSRVVFQSITAQLGNQFLAGSAAVFVAQLLSQLTTQLLVSLRDRVLAALFTTCHLREAETLELIAWLRTQALDTCEVELCADSVIGRCHSLERTYEYKPGYYTSTHLRFYSKAMAERSSLSQWLGSKLLWIQFEELKKASGVRASIAFMGRNAAPVEVLLNEGRALAQEKRRNSQFIEVISTYDFEHVNYKGLGWLTQEEGYHIGMVVDNQRMGRPMNSVVLPVVDGEDQGTAILEDCREFLSSEQWYTDRGIPYQRGYLLHGLPGTGKTSLIMALASALELPVYVIQLSSEQLDDESLQRLMQTVKAKTCILLFEDVDAATEVVKRRPVAPAAGAGGEVTQEEMLKMMHQTQQTLLATAGRDSSNRKNLTLAGLLNTLDGPFATKGRIVFMTTNHKQLLDPAIIRPGRIDFELEFAFVTEEQVCRQFDRFYADLRPGDNVALAIDHATRELLAQQFAAKLTQKAADRFTSADIQGYLMKYRKDPARALQELETKLLVNTNR